jgi:hypothetical protein
MHLHAQQLPGESCRRRRRRRRSSSAPAKLIKSFPLASALVARALCHANARTAKLLTSDCVMSPRWKAFPTPLAVARREALPFAAATRRRTQALELYADHHNVAAAGAADSGGGGSDGGAAAPAATQPVLLDKNSAARATRSTQKPAAAKPAARTRSRWLRRVRPLRRRALVARWVSVVVCAANVSERYY